MNKIGLIDVDSSIPNIPLMKLSTFYKEKGDDVKLIKLNIPYYPNRKKKITKIPNEFDKLFASVIFKGNEIYVEGREIEFGGTGYSLKKIYLKK